jgi:aldose 1-epimerase
MSTLWPADLVTLHDGLAECVVWPAHGGGAVSYDWLARGRREALFRTSRVTPETAAFDLANINLVPWSNRISGGGFHAAGAFHELAPNVPGIRFPIHGNGFAQAWSVRSRSPVAVELELASIGPGPYIYVAGAGYALSGGALTMTLSVTHRAALALPYGLGYHPWLPRTAGMTLLAPVERMVLKDAEVMNTGDVAISERPECDFRQPRALPGGLIDNDFLGWSGRAVIDWHDRDLRLDVDASADPRLRTCVIYSPHGGADFFCFEPVTHRCDAHNLAGGPEANGLAILEPGQTLAVSCTFRPSALSTG